MAVEGTPKYFGFPFGVNGTLTTVPDTTQPSGVVSYQQGFGPDYTLPADESGSLDIPQGGFNQLLFDITSTLQQIYQNGFPLFITSAMNDGSPYAYAENAYVYQPSNGNVYYSLINNNTDVPPTANWQIVGGPTATSYFNAATDTGTANHYVIAPTPSIGTPAAGDIVILQPVNANTGSCDININGNGAVAIKTLQNQDPIAGMIIPAGTYLLSYNAITGYWVLLNPALGTAAYYNVGTGANQIVQLNGSAQLPAVSGALLTGLISGTAGATGKIVLSTLGITVQWGQWTITTSAGAGTAVTFGTAFSGSPYSVMITGILTSNPSNFTTGQELIPGVRSVTSAGCSAYGPTSFTGQMYYLAIGPT